MNKDTVTSDGQNGTNNAIHNDDDDVFVFFDIQIDDDKVGRVIIQLYKHIVPKTVENFRQFCTGEAGTDVNGIHLCYKGTRFHRALSQFMVQGGDVAESTDCSLEGVSIYGGPFDDENFKITHNKEGLVGMANNGPNTNYSQFYITTVNTCEHLDGRNVAFGQVIKGFGIIQEIANVPRDDDKPLIKCTIANCGEITDGNFNINECDGTPDIYPPYPADFTFPSSNVEAIIANIKESGNYFFNKQSYVKSGKKYRKVIRYIDYVLEHNMSHDRSVVNKVKTFSLANLAAVKLKKGFNDEVILICNELIGCEPENGKAYYRRGVAHLKVKEYDKAINDFAVAMKLLPEETAIEQLCATARKHRLRYIQHERNIYSKMFQN